MTQLSGNCISPLKTIKQKNPLSFLKERDFSLFPSAKKIHNSYSPYHLMYILKTLFKIELYNPYSSVNHINTSCICINIRLMDVNNRFMTVNSHSMAINSRLMPINNR